MARLPNTLEAIELLLDQGRDQDVLTALNQLSDGQLSADERASYYLLKAEACLRTGTYEIEAMLAEAVDFLKKSSDSSRFGKSKFLQGWKSALTGDHELAREAFLEAYASYLRCDDLQAAAQVLNYWSYSNFKTGNISQAIDNLKRAHVIYTENGSSFNANAVRLNLCHLEYSIGQITHSIENYDELHSKVDCLSEHNRSLLFYMSALPHALKGDLKTARKTIHKAKPYLDKYIRDKAIYFENLGFIEILAQEYSAAERALDQGLKISLEIAPESALISQIKRLFGDLYVATEKWKKARKFATEALAVAEKINERIEIAACWRVLARVALHNHEDDEARRLFDRSIDLFNQIGARYELAVTRYHAATSGLYSDAERSALLFLARDYFGSEHIDHWIERIESDLKVAPPVPIPGRTAPDPAGAPIFLHRSKNMQRLVEFATYVAPTDMSILLTGETGVGKDMLARFIHYHSGRSGKFVPVNTAAIPDEMIESELFGHARGAYTGAADSRKGLIEEANDGTLYLNEIADSSMSFQAKLLEVLETRRVRPLGQNSDRPVTFRLIAATNHDLRLRIQQQQFRDDLYHRLNDLPIHIPPLRDRTDDFAMLIEHFLKETDFDTSTGAASKAIERIAQLFKGHRWEGNVRQLRSEVRRLSLMAKNDPARLVENAKLPASDDQKDLTLTALRSTGGNKSRAAEILGISEAAVRKRLRKYGVMES